MVAIKDAEGSCACNRKGNRDISNIFSGENYSFSVLNFKPDMVLPKIFCSSDKDESPSPTTLAFFLLLRVNLMVL